MSNKLIRQLFETRLKNWAAARNPVLRVAYQDVAFIPLTSETYLRCFLLPANTSSDDLQGVHKAYRGVWQVSIVKPAGGGLVAAGGIEDELAALFPNNLELVSGAFKAYVRTPMSAATAIVEPLNTTIPVSCSYRADTI
ncbi:hypothetical protein D3879_14640 [Pseudomonas cavernicola]|uniref:Uncharacterized protein n=1 Tax=Pseudomonas cavernicola TaxID=2320866 RepID=A0A418XEH5_9PSED|nr:phage tail terminator-like protein [Pseudomonas cavernicola]RJG10915.1 hypothetical protein D3879_14640 [Pseudomonas cavernicola]